MNNISIETKRADIEEKSSLYDIVKQYLIDYPLRRAFYQDVPYTSGTTLTQNILQLSDKEIVYVSQNQDPDILNINFRISPYKWVLKVPHDSNKIYLVLDVDINEISDPDIKNFVDHLKCAPNIVFFYNDNIVESTPHPKDNPQVNLNMSILRDRIVYALRNLLTCKGITCGMAGASLNYTVTLVYHNKTVSLNVSIEDDACVLRSSEMYANYQFKHSRFGNISMQRILNPQYPNEVIGACLTTDAVNEILCYLSDKYKKVSLFDYLRPVLDTWVGGPYLIDNKQQGDKRVYLQFIGDYKKVVIEELDIPEKLRFTSTNCFNEEGFIKIAENGEDIEIVLDRTKFQDKEVQGFIDHLIKELNATTSITRTSILNAKEDIKMENKNSALDNLFYNVVECIEKLSIAIKQNTNPIYILKGTSLAVQCTVKKRSDGVIVTSDDQKVFKFSLNMFNEISLSYDTSLPDQLDGVILDIEKQLKQRYPGVGLHVYLFYKLFNVYPVGEQSFMFKVRISAELSDLIITRIDDNACFLTFDIPESQYAFLLAKNVNNDGINIAYVPHSLEISLELKPTLDAFIQRLNLTWTSHNVALDKYEDEVEPSTEDTCDVIVEDDDYYPVMIRTGKSDTRASKIHHLIGEGVRMVEEAYRLDNNSITVSDNVSVRDESSSNGVRNTRLNNARIYHISSDNLFTGDMIVILPVTNIPQVRAVLAHSIFVENGVIEKMVLNHDKLYNNIS